MVLKSMNKRGVACLFAGVMMLSTGVSAAEEAPVKEEAPASPALEKEAVAVASPAPWYENAGKPFKVDALVNLTAGWTENEAEGFDGRPLMSVHRARVWFRGNAHKRLKYVAHLAFDRIGADQYALLQGKPFSASRAPAVQDAFAQWDVYGSGALRLTGGWMRPQIGRENTAVVVALPNQEPALTAALVRTATVGAGHGRATGLNLGGRVTLGESKIFYHLGMFAPTGSGTTEEGVEYDQSMGGTASPLFTGSLMYGYGKMSQLKNGDYLFLPNSWSKDLEILVGGSASSQGETDRFNSTMVYSGFGSISAFGVTVDGEYVAADREGLDGETYGNTAWHARVGYNVDLDDSIFTPFVLVTELSGDDVTAEAWNGGVKGLGFFAGQGRLIDAGFNWHMRQHKLRLGLHTLFTQHNQEEGEPAKLPIREGMAGFLTLQVHQ